MDSIVVGSIAVCFNDSDTIFAFTLHISLDIAAQLPGGGILPPAAYEFVSAVVDRADEDIFDISLNFSSNFEA